MKKRSSTTTLKMPSKSGCIGVLSIFLLVALTLFMAFAFPYTLFHLKQTDTTEIKSVIIIARSGEKSPSAESYFIGEEIPAELHKIGFNQLTNLGKERMYLLGKFLKMKYYHLLLNGDPRKLEVYSEDTDRSLESAQALLAGLNPPRDSWFWSTGGELENWQPKAVHTTESKFDDLLAEASNCFAFEEEDLKWRNSSKYQQLLNEFRHDLQTLRSNTGLEFEDNLEMLSQIDDSLKTRKAFKDYSLPNWYSNTFANRLAHIADVSAENRFKSTQMQRLYVGRLLHEIAEKVNVQIRIHQQSLMASERVDLTGNEEEDNLLVYQEKKNSGKINEPNMFIYMTNKDKLSALMNSLQIYSSQPYFGALLLIEVHYDLVSGAHFLRLFSVASQNPNVLPEPVRLNPIACLDSLECEPQQFEQNIRHLILDKDSWQEACNNRLAPSTTSPPKLPLLPLILDPIPKTESPVESTTAATTSTTTTTSSPQRTTTTTDAATLEQLDENLIVGPTITSTTSSSGGSSSDNSSTAAEELQPVATTEGYSMQTEKVPTTTMLMPSTHDEASSVDTNNAEVAPATTAAAITEPSNSIDTTLNKMEEESSL